MPKKGSGKAAKSNRAAATSKVAISLPTDLLQRIEAARQSSDLDRSSWIQEAARKYLAQVEHAEKIAQYIRGYEEDPETDEEVAEVNAQMAEHARYLDEEERDEQMADVPSEQRGSGR